MLRPRYFVFARDAEIDGNTNPTIESRERAAAAATNLNEWLKTQPSHDARWLIQTASRPRSYVVADLYRSICPVGDQCKGVAHNTEIPRLVDNDADERDDPDYRATIRKLCAHIGLQALTGASTFMTVLQYNVLKDVVRRVCELEKIEVQDLPPLIGGEAYLIDFREGKLYAIHGSNRSSGMQFVAGASTG